MWRQILADATSRTELVSVVIPTFNQADYLREALKSLLQQTYKSWEAIIVNNFSTDRTVEVIESINDHRITWMNFGNDGVIARSRNHALSKCNGQFVAFLDSDDLWEPSKLARAVIELRAGSDLVCHAERWFGGGSRDRIVRYGPSSRATYESLLLNGNCISTSAVVMRREVLDQLGGFRDDPDFVTTEDYDLWLRVAQAGFTVSFIDDVLGSFRRHNASASSAPIRHLNAELSVIDDHFRTRLPQGVTEHKRRRALAYYTAARTFSKDGRTWEGFRMFASSLRMNPLNARTWAGLGVHLISLLQNPLNRTCRD